MPLHPSRTATLKFSFLLRSVPGSRALSGSDRLSKTELLQRRKEDFKARLDAMAELHQEKAMREVAERAASRSPEGVHDVLTSTSPVSAAHTTTKIAEESEIGGPKGDHIKQHKKT